MIRKAILFLIIIYSFSVSAQWNDWKDAESVRKLILKAQNSGKSYFSQFHEYDARCKDFNTSQYHNQTGEIPFIYGLDFYYASGSYFSDSYKQKNRQHIIEIVRNQWRKNKAIPSFSWHLENPYVPSDFGDYMGCRYRYGQKEKSYPEKHRYVIKEILTGAGGETCGFGKFKVSDVKSASFRNPREWFDARCKEIAEIINEFVDDDGTPIPFIFRLWHECEDSWMWWGAQSVSVEDYKKFFIYTENLIKKYAPNAQILWGYGMDRNWNTEEEFMLRYPGDRYVDIVGYDDYQIGNRQKTNETLKKAQIAVKAAKKHGKVSAIFETANLNKQTSGCFFKDCLLPLIRTKEIDFGFIQLWNVGKFDNKLYYNDRMSFLKSPNILIINRNE